jgi:hypothetical protein
MLGPKPGSWRGAAHVSKHSAALLTTQTSLLTTQPPSSPLSRPPHHSDISPHHSDISPLHSAPSSPLRHLSSPLSCPPHHSAALLTTQLPSSPLSRPPLHSAASPALLCFQSKAAKLVTRRTNGSSQAS